MTRLQMSTAEQALAAAKGQLDCKREWDPDRMRMQAGRRRGAPRAGRR